MYDFFATCPKGLEALLLDEVTAMGVTAARHTVAGVSFTAPLDAAARLCLSTRYASRILLILDSAECHSADELYETARSVPWEEYFAPGRTIAVGCHGSSRELHSPQYCALRVKDAVCDRFVHAGSPRPGISRHAAEVRIVVNLVRSRAIICLDLSGRTLQPAAAAQPAASSLRANLAHAILERCGLGDFRQVVDPLCGGGMLLMQAASLLTDRAPGLVWESFGFESLRLWAPGLHADFARHLEEARERARAGLRAALAEGVRLVGYDPDPQQAARAGALVQAAGLCGLVEIGCRPLEEVVNPFGAPCLVVSNPPYDAPGGHFNELVCLYARLGEQLKRQFSGSRAAVVANDPELLTCLKLRAERSYAVNNGQFTCQIRIYEIRAADEGGGRPRAIEEFINRLSKNLRHARRYARTVGTDAFRIYDAELPQYPYALDCYGGAYVLQEYAAHHVSRHKSRNQLLDVIAAVMEVTHCSGDELEVKRREVQSGEQRYQAAPQPLRQLRHVTEGGMTFAVNIHDYLDTGLFLDGRLLRALITKRAAGRVFLNLFCYTATASVAAARGGALRTVNVDISATYLDWALENFRLNALDVRDHEFLQQDCLHFLSHMGRPRFDLVFIDPPTFSNSKRMEGTLDVVRDHVQLMANLTRHLRDHAQVLFCTHKRNFRIDAEQLSGYGYTVRDLTAGSIPEDFRHSRGIHALFELSFARSGCTTAIEPLTTARQPGGWSGPRGPQAAAAAARPGGGAPAPRRGAVPGCGAEDGTDAQL